MRLSGKVAVVTGGGSGIGRGIVHCMAREGASIAIPDIVQENARTVAEEVRALGRDSLAMRCDVTREADIQASFERIKSELGPIDILVNNAGINRVSPIDEVKDTDWDEVLAVNLTAPMILSRALAGPMKGRRWGRIIHISSIFGEVSRAARSATAMAFPPSGHTDSHYAWKPSPKRSHRGLRRKVNSNFAAR